jgi:hypothetical protein
VKRFFPSGFQSPGPSGAGAKAAAAIAAAAALFFAAPLAPSVIVREIRTGRLAAALPVRKGDVLQLAYIHSANKGAVVDEFVVDADGSLLLTRSVFQAFGAGMSDGLEPGVTMRTTSEGVELSGLNRKIGAMRLAVGTVANHRLRGAGREIALADRVVPGTAVTIEFQRIPLFAAVRERIRNGNEQRD